MTKEELRKLLGEINAEEKANEAKEKELEISISNIADKIGEKIADAIATKSVEEKEEIKKELFSAETGFKGIKYPSMKDMSTLTKDEKIVTFFKALVDKSSEGNAVLKALVEGTPADGGYTVPEVLRAEVYRILPDRSMFRRLAMILPMSTDTLQLNSLTASPKAYWTSEYAALSTTSAEFGQISLTPYKLVCLLPITQELLADANIGMAQLIVSLFAEAIANAEDKAYTTGTGSGQPTGLYTTLNASGSYKVSGKASFDKLLEVITLPAQAVRESPKTAIMANKFVIRNLRKIKDDNGNYIWSAGNPNLGQKETIYGYPVYENNHMVANTLIFGDFSGYAIGDRQQLSVSTTMEGGDAWRRDSMEIKAKIRVDGETLLQRKFVLWSSL